jgi:hypothetical protein
MTEKEKAAIMVKAIAISKMGKQDGVMALFKKTICGDL